MANEMVEIGSVGEVASMVGEIMGKAPEVSEHVEAAAPEAGAAAAPHVVDGKEIRDKHGRGFSPDLHEVDGEGVPVVNPASRTLRIKSGRPRRVKPAEQGAPAAAESVVNVAPAPGAGMRDDDAGAGECAVGASSDEAVRGTSQARQFGQMATMGLLMAGAAIDPEEWAPMNIPGLCDQRADLEDAFTAWLETLDLEELPPFQQCLMVVGMYVVPNLLKPRTAAKIRARFSRSPLRAEGPLPQHEGGEGVEQGEAGGRAA